MKREGTLDWTAKGADRIAQNVRNLLNTFQYEVAYHRTMGLPAALIDSPSDSAAAELEVEVRALLARYEPRAKVQDVKCAPGTDGTLAVEVVLID